MSSSDGTSSLLDRIRGILEENGMPFESFEHEAVGLVPRGIERRLLAVGFPEGEVVRLHSHAGHVETSICGIFSRQGCPCRGEPSLRSFHSSSRAMAPTCASVT